MNSEDNNEEILQFKSYEININNPISINKKSEKEKKINPEIIENDKKLRNLISNKELTKEIKNNEEEISKKNENFEDNKNNEKENDKKNENLNNSEIKKENKEEKSTKNSKNEKVIKKEQKTIKNIINKENKFKKQSKKEGKIIQKSGKDELQIQNTSKEKNYPQQVKEDNDVSENKNSEEIKINKLPKTLLTKKIEDNYDLMLKYLKENNKRVDDNLINGIINYDDFSSDKFLGLVSDKKKTEHSKKNMIDDFIKRNKDDTKQRQDNNKTINDRIKLIDESVKKKLYFNSKKSQKEYFDSFYNKQIQYKNNCKDHLDKLNQKYEEELKKICIPDLKKNNLDYFKNNEPIKISKYSIKAKNSKNKISYSNNKEKKKQNSKENQNNKNMNNHSYIYNNKNDNGIKIVNNKDNNNNKESQNKKFEKVRSGDIVFKSKIKLSKKEINEFTNKLHYNGELLKIKKQHINKTSPNSKNYSFSNEKLTRSSIIILIRKTLYEYSISIKKNVYIDLTKNPKINYEQYIDILKDLYYLEMEAFPEDYLEEDTKYKELWNKLTQFSSSPENSLESNVLLIFLLELNGFFKNEKILKELEKELYWIKLEEYDDLIANAKYIEKNWNDLKMEKKANIKKLKLEGKYRPIHYNEFYSNYSNNNSNFNSSLINNDDNHYITTLKGNTNYHLIHGYSSKNKNSENTFIFSNSFNKNEENKISSFSISNLSNNNLKKKVSTKVSYNDLIEKRKKEIDNIKKDEEKKLKEICTFKPQINKINKKIFNKNIKIELPKNNTNKSDNLHKKLVAHNDNSIENVLTMNNQNINDKNLLIKDFNNNNFSHSPNLRINKKNLKQKILNRNKSSLQKMFKDNPLKNDKAFIEKVQKLKNKNNEKEFEKYSHILPPMRFDIEYPSKFENIGVTINKDDNTRLKNTIFYNIKVNDTIKILKYIEGEDLKLNVINFVHKNKLPQEVINIILTKIKEKIIEEIPNKLS